MKAKIVHGERYDYSKVVYVNSTSKVIIICPVHGGQFEQTPASHLQGRGCKTCAFKHISDQKSFGFGDFEKKAKEKHGNAYEYKADNFKDLNTEFAILCKKHKFMFTMTPKNHLAGHGCPECGREEVSRKNSLGFSAFVEKATQIHGNAYNYSQLKDEFINRQKAMNLFCNSCKHFFWQNIESHLRGAKCTICDGKGVPITNNRVLDTFIAFLKFEWKSDGGNKDENFAWKQMKDRIITYLRNKKWEEAFFTQELQPLYSYMYITKISENIERSIHDTNMILRFKTAQNLPHESVEKLLRVMNILLLDRYPTDLDNEEKVMIIQKLTTKAWFLNKFADQMFVKTFNKLFSEFEAYGDFYNGSNDFLNLRISRLDGKVISDEKYNEIILFLSN